jgi:hypothetical protein
MTNLDGGGKSFDLAFHLHPQDPSIMRRLRSGAAARMRQCRPPILVLAAGNQQTCQVILKAGAASVDQQGRQHNYPLISLIRILWKRSCPSPVLLQMI